MSIKKFAFAFTLAIGAIASGCAADSADEGNPDDPNNPSNPDDPSNPSKQLDATGEYEMRSTFDLAQNAPGKVGAVTRAIIEMTDNPEDPSLWLIERIIEQLPSGAVKTALNTSKGFIAGYVNDRVLEFAPDFVSTMVQVGNKFGQISRNFGLEETLTVGKSADGYLATHTAIGAHFSIDGNESTHLFADYGVADVPVANVAIALEAGGKLAISEHAVGISYGAVLRIGLDGAVIPLIDPTADNLAELLQHKISCQQLGILVRDAIASVIGYGGSASTYQTACNAGLVVGANYIYGKIAEIDGTVLELGLAGTAKALDKNGDKTVDSLQTGAWTGKATYAGAAAPLATATFFGERM